PTRLLVQRSIHDELVERAVATATGLPIGDPLDVGTVVGPVITERDRDRILGVVSQAVSEGSGTVLAGSTEPATDIGPGWFVRPVVFDEADPNSSVVREEIFGPVLSIMTFDDEDEAIALANDTRYGLAGYVHTTNVTRAHRVASRLDAGYISINGFAALPASAPFGGYRLSGQGKEGGRLGLAEFYREKNVYLPM
ncbi:MAG: aldehyde dehydrogenase family protein, partial [Myxococcales bacterium]|nr:aldehyde dehydrogenase family protein [Myxococcales bacterium]